MSLNVRPFEETDRTAIFGWIEALGWNPGERDGECLLATDPAGLFVVEKDGVAAACASGIAYDGRCGFGGGLIVDPAWRGRHASTVLAMYRHVAAYLGERCVGMDAMPSSQPFFAAVGCCSAYRHLRFEGPLPGGRPSEAIVPLGEVRFEDVCDYDAANFPARRERFLRVWLEAYGPGGWACVRGGRLAGFGVLRRARRGWRVGPLQADDSETAEDLLRAMGAAIGGGDAALDVPESNAAAMALVRRLGLREAFATERMYLRGVPDVSTARTYSIASYEFG